MYSSYAQILCVYIYVCVCICMIMWLYVIICDYICIFLCRWYGIQVGWIFGFTGMILNDCLWCILHPRWGEKAWSLSLDLGNPSDPQKLDRNLLMLLVKSPTDECLSHHFSCVNQALVWQGLCFTWWLSYRSWASGLESWSMGKPWSHLESSTLRKSTLDFVGLIGSFWWGTFLLVNYGKLLPSFCGKPSCYSTRAHSSRVDLTFHPCLRWWCHLTPCVGMSLAISG